MCNGGLTAVAFCTPEALHKLAGGQPQAPPPDDRPTHPIIPAGVDRWSGEWCGTPAGVRVIDMAVSGGGATSSLTTG
jgi:hypothetical protein